jgi:hypothetical protein
MDPYRETAFFCVGRAVMFGGLAISLVMLSYAFDPATALQAGGMGGLIMSAILLWYAQTASRRPPKKTETFLLLPKEVRPRDESAIRVFGTVMTDTYLFFAVRAFGLSVVMILAGLLLGWLGVEAV